MHLVEQRFAAPAVVLNFAEGPVTGDPLVLLHGGGGRWQYLAHLAEALSATWHVFAPDMRGHGKSGRVPGHYLLRDYVPDVAAFIASQVGEPAVLFGHSLGGEIAIMLTAQHPQLVRALIIGDAPLGTANHPTEAPAHRARNVLWHSLCGRPTAEIEAELRQMPFEGRTAQEVMGSDHGWFKLHAQTLHELDPEMLAAVLAGPDVMLEGYDPHRLLPRITCPTLLIQADPNGPQDGSALRDDEVELALRLIPHVRHVRLSGVGHPLNDVSKVMAALQPFLDELSASGRTRARATG